MSRYWRKTRRALVPSGRMGPVLAVVMCLMLLTASLSVPAFGGQTAFSSAKKALGLAKKANQKATKASRKANRAYRLARQTRTELRKNLKAQGQPGSTGQIGPQGPKGETGPVGLAPKGRSVVALTFDGAEIGTQFQTMADLADINGVSDNEQITTSSPGLIMASVTASFFNSAVNQPAKLRCRLMISDGSGPNSGLTRMGINADYDFPSVGSEWSTTETLTGSVEKQPGTYNVALQCQRKSNSGSLSLDAATVNVWTALK